MAAADPDGDALTYDVASGDGERFAMPGRAGAVHYVGPGEDFESEPNRYELTVRARDPHGAAAEAQVVVPSRLTLMGRPVPVGKEAARRAAEQLFTGWLSSAAYSGSSAPGLGSYSQSPWGRSFLVGASIVRLADARPPGR